MQLVTHLSVLSLAAVVFCQEPAQPPKVESNQTAQQQNEQDHPPRVKLSIKDTKRLVVKRERPVYPDIARDARLEGRCGVRVVITPQGEIAEVRLVYGHPMIAPAALDAVRKWKFRPYLQDGHAVEAEGEVELNVP
jgi:TonB family protein